MAAPPFFRQKAPVQENPFPTLMCMLKMLFVECCSVP